jgi:hypothetical protein
MQSWVTVDFTKEPPTITQMHRCDFTTECDAKTGEVRCQRKASTRRMKCSLLAVEPQVVVRLDCLASNPGTSVTWAFGDIEYKGQLIIDPTMRSIAVDLQIGLFPAFEAYAAINGGMPVIVFRYAPPAGVGVGHVPAGANRPIRTLLVDHDGDGMW